MKSIELKNLDDSQWASYKELIIDIEKKFGEGCLIDDGDWNEYRDFYSVEDKDWQEFKVNSINRLNEREFEFLKEYVLFDGEKAIAWTAIKIYDDRCEFMFDTVYDEISLGLLKSIFECGKNFITDNKKNVLHYWSNDKRKDKIFKDMGIESSGNIFKSKLSKNKMDLNYWKDLVEENEYANKMKLLFCREIPEESYDIYVDFLNEVIIDKELYNPDNPEPTKATREAIIRKNKAIREDKAPFYIYLMYDATGIAAVCSVWVETNPDGQIILNHNGGLTAVSRRHRGKNLALYLKAKMYLKVLEDFSNIEYALTDTFPWNKYMYRLNDKLGFRPYREEYNFEFTLDFLKKLYCE